jgi:hypothetical protein
MFRLVVRVGNLSFLLGSIHCLPAGTFILGYSIARQKLQGPNDHELDLS